MSKSVYDYEHFIDQAKDRHSGGIFSVITDPDFPSSKATNRLAFYRTKEGRESLEDLRMLSAIRDVFDDYRENAASKAKKLVGEKIYSVIRREEIKSIINMDDNFEHRQNGETKVPAYDERPAIFKAIYEVLDSPNFNVDGSFAHLCTAIMNKMPNTWQYKDELSKKLPAKDDVYMRKNLFSR